MKRRKAIGRILLAGGGTVAVFSGYKWYSLSKAPDTAWLVQQQPLIAALAETIIPATQTPGAKAAQVDKFILSMLLECTDRKTLNRFVDGLASVESYTSHHYNKTYITCTANEQQAVMTYLRERDRLQTGMIGKVRKKFLGKPFYTTLRQYTIEGFCTSLQGATQVLRYVAVPGKYIGCMPLQPGETTWATK